MTTKLPQIPSFDGSNTGDVLNAVKEALEVRVGRRGDALDTGVTFRDLEALGYVEQAASTGATGGLSTRASVRSTLSAGAIPALYDPAADLTPPPGPSELKATAVFDTVYLSWNQPVFPNQSFWEVHKSFTNDLSTAVLAGTSTSQFFTDVVQEGVTLYYWVRTVSAAGIKSAWNSSFGTEVKTGIDPAKLIAALEGQILESSLAQDLATRINDSSDQTRIAVRKLTKEINDRIAADTAEANARTAAINAEVQNRINAINAEAAARAAAISAEAATRAQALIDEAAARGTAITNEANLRIAGDTQLAQQITTLTANINDPVTGFASIAALQAEQTARANGDSAQATARETLAAQLRGSYDGTDVTQLSSGLVFSERQARVSADSALASRSEALEATVNNPTTGLVATRATLVNDYYTKAATDSAISATSTTLTSQINTKNRTYAQASAPTGNLVEGDLWYDTDDSNKTYRYQGGQWVASDDTRISGTISNLSQNYYTKAATDSAIAASSLTLQSQIDGVSSNLSQNYYTKSAADSAIAASTNSLRTEIANPVTGYASRAFLSANYFTQSDTNSAIAASENALRTEIADPVSGYATKATLTTNYFTKTETNSAITAKADELRTEFADPATGYATKSTLTTNYYTKSAADSAIAAKVNELRTEIEDPVSGYATKATLTSNYLTSTATNNAITAKVDELRSEITDPVSGYATKATLTSQYFTQTQTNSAITGQINTLRSEIEDPINGYAKTATVEQNYFAKAEGNALKGQYTVKIDLNGHVSGFGLASTVVNGTPTSAFIVRADRFAVVDPASTANGLGTTSPSADTVPFFVEGGVTYIKNAVIKDASITDAKIGSVAAKKITAGYIGATIAMDGASVFGASLYAGGTTSKTYDAQGYVTSFTAQNPTFKVENGNVEIVSTNFRIKSLATANSYVTPFKVENGVVYIDTLAVIKAGEITTAMIQNAEITSAQIINLQATKIVPGPNGLTIDANLITLDGGVTLDTYYDSSIGRSRLRIKDLGVTTAKINDLAVTNGKIDNLAVSTLKIAGNAITQPEVYTAADVYIANNSSAAIQLTNSGVSENFYEGAPYDYAFVQDYDWYTGNLLEYYDYVGPGNGTHYRVVTYGPPTFINAITVIETPVVTVGIDATAAVQIVYYATHDGSIYSYNDSGQHLFMLLDTGAGYRLVAQQQVGLRTDSSADTMASLPIAMTFTARNITTARVKILTGSRRVDLPMGNFSNPCWLRNSTISLLGAKR